MPVESLRVGVGPPPDRLGVGGGGELFWSEAVLPESFDPLVAKLVEVDAGLLGGAGCEGGLLAGEG